MAPRIYQPRTTREAPPGVFTRPGADFPRPAPTAAPPRPTRPSVPPIQVPPRPPPSRPGGIPGGLRPPGIPGGHGGQTPGGYNFVSPARRDPYAAPLTPRDFRREALLLHPWLATMPELLNAYVAGYVEFGDPALALAALRDDPMYDVYFAGNRRPDGSFRLSEAEYFSNMDAYAGAIADIGLNPELFRSRFVDLIEGDDSPAEFTADLRELYNGLFNSGPVVEGHIRASMRYYADNYGVEMTPEAILAGYIDENVGSDILRQRISVSQVGGGAHAFGYNRSRQRVEELMGYGLDTLDESVNFYRGVQARQPNDTAIARRHFDPLGGVGVETYENAYLAGGWADQQRLARNLRSELVSFSPRRAAQTDRGGLASGLVDR